MHNLISSLDMHLRKEVDKRGESGECREKGIKLGVGQRAVKVYKVSIKVLFYY